MAYTAAERRIIDEKSAEFFNRLNLRFRESGRLLTKKDVNYHKATAQVAAEAYVESVDIDGGGYLMCEELVNPETGNSGVVVEHLLDAGGQSFVFLTRIPNFDALNPVPFYQRILQHRLRMNDGGNLDSVRAKYAGEASDLIKYELKRASGREFIRSELKPLLMYKLRDGKGVLRINRGGGDVFSPKKAERVRAFDGYVHERVLFSALSSKTNEQRDFSLSEYIGRVINHQKISEALSLQEKIKIMMYCADGTNAFYQLDTAHRDIKPDNVLVYRTESGELGLRIIDLGLVKLTKRIDPNSGTVTDVGKGAGTLKFGSPEHFLIPEDVDVQSDICSLGLTGYFWITGEHAILGVDEGDVSANAQFRIMKPKRIVEMSNRIKYGSVPFWNLPKRIRLDNISQELEKVIAKMIYTDTRSFYDDKKDITDIICDIEQIEVAKRFGKDKRHKTPAEVISDLEGILAGKRINIGDINISEVFN